MLNLLLLVIPDHSEVQNQEHGEHYLDISPQTLDDDAKSLIEKLEYFSSYITR